MANSSKGFEWAYRDLLTALMVVFMALGLLAIISAQKLKTIEGIQPGQMFIQMSWKTGSTSDIDLWTISPGDDPVGYQRTAGKNCDLLRDDLGLAVDHTSKAIEFMVCRDPPPGEYIINSHFYMMHTFNGEDLNITRTKELPMTVKILVTKTSKSQINGLKKLLEKEITFDHDGQEITVARFELDSKGDIVPGSINDVPKMIRTHDGSTTNTPQNLLDHVSP